MSQGKHKENSVRPSTGKVERHEEKKSPDSGTIPYAHQCITFFSQNVQDKWDNQCERPWYDHFRYCSGIVCL